MRNQSRVQVLNTFQAKGAFRDLIYGNAAVHNDLLHQTLHAELHRIRCLLLLNIVKRLDNFHEPFRAHLSDLDYGREAVGRECVRVALLGWQLESSLDVLILSDIKRHQIKAKYILRIIVNVEARRRAQTFLKRHTLIENWHLDFTRRRPIPEIIGDRLFDNVRLLLID